MAVGGKWTPPNPYGGFSKSTLPPPATPAPKKAPTSVKIQTGTVQARTQFGPVGTPQPTYTKVGVGTRADDRSGVRGAATSTSSPKPTVKPVATAPVPAKQPALPSTAGKTTVPARTVTPQPQPTKTSSPAKPTPTKSAPRAATTASTQQPISLTPQQQAAQAVQQLLAPLYAQQNTQAAAQNDAINNYTRAMVSQLQGVPSQVQGDYNNAYNAQSALVGSAADALRNANPNQQDQQLLQAIGAPDAQQQQIQSQNANVFNGGGAVGRYVNGVLPLGSLQSQGLAATSLARLQPGFAALRGQQALAGALYQQGQARQKIDLMAPDLTQKYEAAQTAADQKQQYLDMVARKFGYTVANSNRDFNYKVATANAKLSQIDPSVSKVLGYVATADGTPITKGGKIITVNTTTGKQGTAKPPTAGQLNNMVQAWKNGKVQNVNVLQPNPDTNGNPVYKTESASVGKLDYGQAYSRLRAMGLNDQKARQYLNTAYERGQQGRAWVTNEEQAVLRKNGLPAKAKVVAGHGVLTLKQAHVLQQAGVLPAGQQTSDGYYVIAQTY